ncbi:MAG: hypothetical protein P8Y79_05695 [Ignavibacteriaceae bacterium]
MKWNLLDTGFNRGRFNMDFDVELVQRKLMDQTFLRFYRWKPYCISLGFNQLLESIDSERAKKDNIDIVRRPTGGRAILHAEELTYSVVYPVNGSYSLKTLYHEINLALKMGLEIYHPSLQKLELEHNQPQFQSFYKENKSTLCFAVSAKSEINFMGKKLVGSAQRKIGNLVLQHGSILCGKFHLNLVDYLNMHNDEKDKIREEISRTTTELSSIINEKVDYEKLIISLKAGFEKQFKFSFEDNIVETVLN